MNSEKTSQTSDKSRSVNVWMLVIMIAVVLVMVVGVIVAYHGYGRLVKKIANNSVAIKNYQNI